MFKEKSITGNLINAYYICHRKLWLFAHKISPTQDNTNIAIGKLIANESYNREKKEIQFDNVKIDFIKKENGNIIISEVKKSSKCKKAAKMQLLYYLYKLKLKGINTKGILLIPKERKKFNISLTEDLEKELLRAIKDIENILKNNMPAAKKNITFCKKCAFFEFCWS